MTVRALADRGALLLRIPERVRADLRVGSRKRGAANPKEHRNKLLAVGSPSKPT